MNKRWRNVGLYVLAVIAVIFVGTSILDKPNAENATKTLRYSDFIEAVQEKEVSRVLISPDNGTAQVVENDGSRSEVNLAPDKDLLKILTENDVDIAVQPTRLANPWQQALSSLLFPVLLIGGLFFLFRRAQGGSGGGGGNPAMSFGKSKARLQMEPSTKVTFADVAGVEGSKLELSEVVDFLKSPDRFTAVGAKIPKGVLLVGPPGTGKTLLAKAVAGEAGVPFFSISGSEFVEMFVGVGASRVRDLFEQAKKNAPCIVFIDEIDAVGRQRGAGLGGGNDEREQTLNQLLTQLDGFTENSGIIVLAATNRPDILDPALLRPGRFDRKIEVLLPDNEERRKILAIHSLNKPLSNDVDLQYWASRTIGFSGADLENLMNESAIHCARNLSKEINNDHIDDALEKITLGLRTTRLSGEKTKKFRAYNEAGRAIVSAANNGIDSIDKITILQRAGNLGGYTKISPDEEVITSGLISKKLLLNKIEIALAGRAAETLVFGRNEITQLASRDIAYSTEIAKEMITKYGFSSIGPVNISQNNEDIFLGDSLLRNKSIIADKTSLQIDKEIMQIAKDSLNKSIKILERNRSLLDKLVDVLIHEETITKEDFYKLSSKLLKV